MHPVFTVISDKEKQQIFFFLIYFHPQLVDLLFYMCTCKLFELVWHFCLKKMICRSWDPNLTSDIWHSFHFLSTSCIIRPSTCVSGRYLGWLGVCRVKTAERHCSVSGAGQMIRITAVSIIRSFFSSKNIHYHLITVLSAVCSFWATHTYRSV